MFIVNTEFGSISFELKRRPVKNIRISVLAPDGKVQVVAPKSIGDASLKAMISKRADWIRKHQQHFLQRVRQGPICMIDGEQHYLLGKPYILEVVYRNGRHKIQVQDNKLVLFVRSGTSTENKKNVLYDFYRQELVRCAEPMFSYWQNELGVTFKQWRIRRMKTRWGSCSPHNGNILLNLELSKQPLENIEYVVLHELAHLIEPSHNKKFKSLLDFYMGDWRQRQADLNNMSL